MIRYIARRLLFLVPTLLIIITVIFFIIRVAPGGPFDSEKKIPRAVKENLEKKYNLDQPLGIQYLRYLSDILFRFDLGPSYSNRAFTVNELIAMRLPVSALVGGLSMILALLSGITLGIFAARSRRPLLQNFFTGLSLTGISFPLFFIAPVLILVLARWMGLVPVAGWGRPGNLLVPVISLSLPYTAYISRLTKTGITEIYQSDFIRTARARG
jgi:oligopeptide transport system permease protein